MGKRGPKKRPAELEALLGFPGKRKVAGVGSDGAAIGVPGGGGGGRKGKERQRAPRMPAWLSDRAKSAWKSMAPVLMRMGLFGDGDWMAFSVLCATWADWRDAHDAVKRMGRRAKTDKGYEYANAAHVVERKLAHDFLRIAESFGMTPSGRSGLSVQTEEKANGLKVFVESQIQARAARAAMLKSGK